MPRRGDTVSIITRTSSANGDMRARGTVVALTQRSTPTHVLWMFTSTAAAPSQPNHPRKAFATHARLREVRLHSPGQKRDTRTFRAHACTVVLGRTKTRHFCAIGSWTLSLEHFACKLGGGGEICGCVNCRQTCFK